jgi:hypothetical protein
MKEKPTKFFWKLNLKSITIHSALQYPHFPCSNVNAAKEEIYHNAKTDLQCGQNGTCQIQVDIKGIITTFNR